MSSSKLNLFICSADGFTGSHLAYFLANPTWRNRFETIICGGTDEKKLRELKEAGLDVVKYNPKDRSNLEKCFHNMHVVYVIPPVTKEMTEAGTNMIHACKSANVKCALFLSVMEAEHGRRHEMLKKLVELEETLKKSGPDSYAIMRVNIYMQTFLQFAEHIREANKNEFTLPLNEQQKFVPISVKDVTAFTAAILTGKRRRPTMSSDMTSEEDQDAANWEEVSRQDGPSFQLPEAYHKKTICLTGREPLTAEELVKRANSALKTQFKFKSIQREEAEHILKENKELNECKVQLILDIFDLIKEGKLDKVTDDFEKVVGRKPMEIEKFFKDHSSDFKSGPH